MFSLTISLQQEMQILTISSNKCPQKKTGTEVINVSKTTQSHITRPPSNASTSAKVVLKLKVQNMSFSWQHP